MAWTTPRTWVPGELVTAAMMNAHVRDNLNVLRAGGIAVAGQAAGDDFVAADATSMTVQSGRQLRQSFRGLQLRTHPDANVATSQLLFSADEIVMDDGQRLGPWTNTGIDVTASGAGGLDTGSEGASRWYEAYAIAKDDGTLNGLLHRAKDYLLSEQQTTETGGLTLRYDATTQVKLGQSFTVGTAGPVPFVDVRLNAATSAPTGNIWFTIEGDSGGFPNGAPVATSDKMDASKFSTTSGWIRFVFRVPASLALSTTYHLVLQGDYTASTTVAIQWQSNSAGGYGNGRREAFDASWSASAGQDMAFKIYVTENDVAVTMPTSYTKKCLIGHVYNNSGSDFVAFVAEDRQVMTDMSVNETGTIASAIPVLTDFSTFVPPRLVRVDTILSVSADGVIVYVAPVPDGYKSTAGFRVGTAVQGAGGVGVESTIGPPVITEFQALYISSASGSARAAMMGYRW